MTEQQDGNREATEASAAMLDSSGLPALILLPDGQVVYANRAAQVLLAAARTFLLVSGRLSVHRRPDREAMLSALEEAARGGVARAVRFRNRQNDITHLAMFTPLPGSRFVRCGLAELGGPTLLRLGWTVDALGLTRLDAALAEALANGENLAEFAERTGLTIGGARTRLKKLLARTGARSQADLVAMVLRAAAIFPGPTIGVQGRDSRQD